MDNTNLQRRGTGDIEEGKEEGTEQRPHLSPYIYLSRVNDHDTCPRKYLYIHHHWLRLKDTPSYFTFGRVFHEVVEDILKRGFEQALVALRYREDIDDNTKDSLMLMSDAFNEEYLKVKDFKLLSTETPVMYNLPEKIDSNLTHFKKWIIKADFIHQDEHGVWVDDIKTTSGYGSATQRFYHTSGQTLTYQFIAKSHMPNIQGTKIWVVTKAKSPKCVVEPILTTDKDMIIAQKFIETSHKALEKTEYEAEYPHRLTSCHNSHSGECPYLPLCEAQWLNRSQDYIKELKEMYYKIEDPDDHLNL